MKKIMKKTITAVICAMLLAATMGMTALAASGDIWGSLFGNTGYATVENTSGSTRYCSVTLREYDYSPSNYTLVTANSGTISSGNTITATGEISKLHAQGYGYVYKSSVYQSGVEWTQNTQIK